MNDRAERFEALVEANRRRLLGIARSYARGDAAEELYQEMLLQLWRGFDRFEGRSHVDTWLYRVALNTALTWRRRLRPDAQANQPITEATAPSVPASGRSELAILDEFIDTLDAADRAVFLLYLEDLSYSEMAAITGLSESHVGVKINRVKKAFIKRYVEG